MAKPIKNTRSYIIFFTTAAAVLAIWTFYIFENELLSLFIDYWFMTIVMVFGSFIAGASSEGGGAIAYPVMTLFFNIEPDVARNFSFAVQSFGMTFAAFWIFLSKIKIEKTYLFTAGIGGLTGIILGSWFIAPYVPSSYAKMMFVSFWLSFGIALWVVNFVQKRESVESLPTLTAGQKTELLLVGVAGGIFSSILGNGLDICTFAYVILKYGLSEKVATPTSVILMASNAIAGFLIHAFVLESMQTEAINYLLVCIPVVIFGAPLGAFTINKIGRKPIASILFAIIVIQFLSALFIIKPGFLLLIFSFGVFMTGVILFFILASNHKQS
ncbi:MAG TPA: sulfite exporter TauE/SafE family protein [Balneolaceae bacterium]|nr:sulfite exporter TauE/SafE family protein [Balneolaceae bacterium]